MIQYLSFNCYKIDENYDMETALNAYINMRQNFSLQ